MVNEYISNFENNISSIIFLGFKAILIMLVSLLMVSLIILAVGCLIKSQNIKSKFLIRVIFLFLGNILFLTLPYLFVHFKNIINII